MVVGLLAGGRLSRASAGKPSPGQSSALPPAERRIMILTGLVRAGG
ncbi:MAG: hypothetical protein LBE84_04470 [Planctomycetota bacterium]|jgi:hypothetical protein|nr:hypothetical protein [Planctomycetota bacterium]